MSYHMTVTPKDAATIGICTTKPVNFESSTPLKLKEIRDKVKVVADSQWESVRLKSQLRRENSGGWLTRAAEIG